MNEWINKMKIALHSSVLAILLLTACQKEHCVSCVIQHKTTKEIVAVDTECDKSADYISGYYEGVHAKYEKSKDTLDVICDFD